MASTYSPNLRLELIGTGEQQGTWGVTTNTNLGTLLEEAIGGYVSVTVTDGADTVLTTVNGGADQSRNMVIDLTGTLTAARNVICPAIEKLYVVNNNTTGGFSVTFKVAGQTGVTIVAGTTAFLYVNGTDAVAINPAIPNGSITTAKLGGDITTAGKALLDDADAAAQRTTLGLGTMSVQNANNVNITGGSITNVTLPATPGDSVLSARSLTLPSYIGTAGNYLKANYPLIGSLTSLQIYGSQWNPTSIPSASASNNLNRAGYGNGVWLTGYIDTTLRRSTDNGLTWSYISPAGTSGNNVVGTVYGNGVWVLVSSSSTARRSTDNGLTWSAATGSIGSPLCVATDGAGVWIVGGSGGGLYRSIDNGSTWSAITSGVSQNINDIAFGNGAWVFVCSTNTIMRSVNGGSTWTSIASPFGGGNYNSISTDGAGTWVASNGSGGVIRSTDNGTSFSTVSTLFSLLTIATNGSGTWIGFNGTTNGKRSTDNGVTWSDVSVNITGSAVNDVAFGNSRFVAVGAQSSISSDNGASWTACSAQYLAKLLSISNSSNAAIAISDSAYYARSTDNGSSWSFVSTPIPLSSGFGIPTNSAFGNSVFVICGYTNYFTTPFHSRFYRSSDNGLTWFDVSPAGVANSIMYTIGTNGSGTWISGGQLGKFYRSTDNGLSWGSQFTVAALGTANSIRAIGANGNTWIALTLAGIARSTDNGVNWSSLTTGVGGTPYDVKYSNGVWIVVGTSTPNVRYSTDDGATWATSSGTGTGSMTVIGSDGGDRWVTAGSSASEYRISKDKGLTFSLMGGAPLNPSATGSLAFLGNTITAVSSGSSQDGLPSATQFNVPSTLANSYNYTYLYTGQ